MSTTIEIKVPDIGEFRDVPVIEISVAAGDKVSKDDTLIIVESDKATLDIPSSADGIVDELKVFVDDSVSEGSVILTLKTVEKLQSHPANKGTSQDYDQPSLVVPEVEPPRAASSISEIIVTDTSPELLPIGTTSTTPAASIGNTPVPAYASPSVRRLARQLGVSITEVKGSGPKQRILRGDVKAFVKDRLIGITGSVQLSPDLAAIPEWPKIDFSRFGRIERQPLSRINKLSGPALARNAMVIPHVTHFDKADVTDIESFRQTLNSEASEQQAKITMLSFAVKAVVAALKEYPRFNASLDGDDLVIKHYWHIGIAADTTDGLVVPVIQDADCKSLREIADEMATLAKAARESRLRPTDMQGATFTISSLGGIGGTNFTPIINAPEVGILGMPRSEIQPVWNGKKFKPRHIQPLSLSFDHRVVDGAAAARFTASIAKLLADFRRISV